MADAPLGHLAIPGRLLDVRVTPGAARDDIREEDGTLRVRVTVAPENGKANAAVLKLMAKALGVPKSRLTLLRGATSRNKQIRVDT